MPSATNNLFAPEMAKNSPIETRTSRMAYCSQSLLPCSTNWTNRFQSISYPSIGSSSDFIKGCAVTIPVYLAPRDLCVHPFDPLSAEGGSYEWISKVLRLPRNLVAPEFHDADGVGRLVVIGQDELGDPKIATADDSPDGKPLI